MNKNTTGILAAISAPLFYAVGFIIWDMTWKKAGGSAFALNLLKCNLASIGFAIMCFCLGFTVDSYDIDIETDFNSTSLIGSEKKNYEIFTTESICFLILSSFIGIIIGDLAWLEALRLLGATRVMVVDTIKPFVAVAFGKIFLYESIHNVAYLGIILTICGILMVSLESDDAQGHNPTKDLAGEIKEHINDVEDNLDCIKNTNSIYLTAKNCQRNKEDVEVCKSTLAAHMIRPNENKCVMQQGVISTSPCCDNVMANERDDASKTIHSSTLSFNFKEKGQVQQKQVKDQVTKVVRKSSILRSGYNITQLFKTKNTSLTQSNPKNGSYLCKGYIFAIVNVILDTGGSLLTKQHGKNMSTWAINLIRFGFAGVFMLLISSGMCFYKKFFQQNYSGSVNAPSSAHNVVLLHGIDIDKAADNKKKNDEERTLSTKTKTAPSTLIVEEEEMRSTETPSSLPESFPITKRIPWYILPKMKAQSWVKIVAGISFVTFICPALSNYALFQIALALAITLGSISPLYALVLEWALRQKKPTLRSCVGSTFAVAGVVVLSLWSSK